MVPITSRRTWAVGTLRCTGRIRCGMRLWVPRLETRIEPAMTRAAVTP